MAEIWPTQKKRITGINFRFLCLAAATLVYTLFSNPTPDIIGLPEILVAILLLLSIGPAMLLSAIQKPGHTLWQQTGRIALIYGCTVPVLIALINQNSLSLILRDIIPFAFMVLPLWLYPLIAKNDHVKKLYTILIIAAGIIFAGRVLIQLVSFDGAVSILFIMPSDPFFLTNSPTVVFTGMFLLGLAAYKLYISASFSGTAKAVALLCLSLIPLTGMALMTQRATIGYTAVMMVCLAILGLCHRPVRALWPLLLAAALVALLWPAIAQVIESLSEKTASVGLNMRWQETLAVYDELKPSVISMLFGNGWGATLQSPAVGGVTVNFTHILLSSYWLKTGMIGLMLVVFYLYAMLKLVWRLVFCFPVMGLALAGVLAINILLYASFKSLDFGLILLLIPLWAEHRVELKDSRG